MRRTVENRPDGRKKIQYASIDDLFVDIAQEKKSENIAVALNMLLPGSGDFYCGKIARGIAMFIVTVIFLSINGLFILIMWPILIVDAKAETEKFNKRIDADFQKRVKKCPHCKETILRNATVCEFCLVDIAVSIKHGYSRPAFKCPYCIRRR